MGDMFNQITESTCILPEFDWETKIGIVSNEF